MLETILLLHGIWMRPVSLQALAQRLRQSGYTVISPAYPSVRGNPCANADGLFTVVRHLSTDRLHIVAHSLGGIVALHLLMRYQDELPPGRLVTLGTPINGSGIARRLRPIPLLGKAALGNSLPQGLAGDVAPDGVKREWGAIIGTHGIGLGSPFLWNKGDHDGAVLVDEATHGLQADRLLMPVSHTGMLFSKAVFTQVKHFLCHGHFNCG